MAYMSVGHPCLLSRCDAEMFWHLVKVCMCENEEEQHFLSDQVCFMSGVTDFPCDGMMSTWKACVNLCLCLPFFRCLACTCMLLALFKKACHMHVWFLCGYVCFVTQRACVCVYMYVCMWAIHVSWPQAVASVELKSWLNLQLFLLITVLACCKKGKNRAYICPLDEACRFLCFFIGLFALFPLKKIPIRTHQLFQRSGMSVKIYDSGSLEDFF